MIYKIKNYTIFYFCIFNYSALTVLPALVRSSPRPLKGEGLGAGSVLVFLTPHLLTPYYSIPYSPPPPSLDISLKIWQIQMKVVILHH